MPWRPTRGVLLPCAFALLPSLLRSQRFSSLARPLRSCSGGCSNTCATGQLFYVPSSVSCHTCVVPSAPPHFVYFLTRKLAVCLSVLLCLCYSVFFSLGMSDSSSLQFAFDQLGSRTRSCCLAGSICLMN
jgi:hypothetical protein